MTTPTILIVDDDKMTRQTLSLALQDSYQTIIAKDGKTALTVLREEEIDVVLSDLFMPGMNGIELLEEINRLPERPPVIFITGQGTVETAVQAMKLGAYDYVTKPVNIDRLCLTIEKTLETKRLKEENILLKEKIKENFPDLSLIGESPAMRKIKELAGQVAATSATVLIEGESGTGKELITNIIHYNSPVAHGPFIKVNCAAFAEGVLESELFGHEKGAFTGAVAAKKGRFELADNGTLFLDEIGEMPASIQVKLLRFLQEQTFERVGGTKTLKVRVRIIS
ncbi:MAG: sigma-54-dependent transcriptional regulator, partial [Thermodesulfobacteriota bacterium]